ncbi:MAG: glycosyltransferase family 2 protein [Candidatus Omnitrophota bacterium]
MSFNAEERCDIIIPVWNHPDLTRGCIDSIKRHTRFPYRIVAVDNASDPPTRDYLDSLQKHDGRVVVIRNEKNEGFVKAVNQGMRFSDAGYVCILNNDTVVTDGWLGEMVDILRKNDGIGIINPSSNTSCQFPGEMDIDTYAETLKTLKGEYQELYTCRAFAMVVERKVIDEIGYLDDVYGMGYFDDTDYCKRAQKLGFRTVRAKASYVYHKERQSFDKIKERSAIFSENEDKFIRKWGRQLRVAYILPVLGKTDEIKKISSNINRIAKIGHQVWIFTKRGIDPRLMLIDHENIRFFYYPGIFFPLTVLYKVWKRKKKKKLHMIVTNDGPIFKTFKFFKDILDADVMPDSDFSQVEKKINSISR